MIGSPAIEIQRGPRAVWSSMSRELNGCFSSKLPTELGMAAEQRGQRMAEQLACGATEQGGHARADVGDAVFGIDLPQPAHAALLIFLKKQARAFALGAEIGIGLELLEGPAGDVEHAEDGHAEREQDRQHVLEGNRRAAEEQGGSRRRR